jgi:hypothetical protein
MRYAIHSLILFAVVTALTAAGCAKKPRGIQLSEKTTASMGDVQQSLQQASAQIDATNASLTQVIKTGESSVQPEEVKNAFEAYSDNVKKMDRTAQALNKQIDQMHSRGNSYFQEWSKAGGTYTNPQMQKLSAQERVRLNNSFTDITASIAGMRGSLNAYASEVKQIQTFLSNNLTAKGVSSIAPIAQAAERDGAELKRSFQPVYASIEQARLAMVPGAAAAGGQAPGQQPSQNQVAPQTQQPQSLSPQNQPLQNQQPQQQQLDQPQLNQQPM